MIFNDICKFVTASVRLLCLQCLQLCYQISTESLWCLWHLQDIYRMSIASMMSMTSMAPTRISRICWCLQALIKDFLCTHVLFWIEAMNLLQVSSQCARMLLKVRECIQKVRKLYVWLYFNWHQENSTIMVVHFLYTFYRTFLILQTLLNISLQVQQHPRLPIYISQHWQHGQRIASYRKHGKNIFLPFHLLLMSEAI